jgi:hypothetical protein
MQARTVYYLPGHNGQISTGLGQGLMDRGWAVAGRQTLGEFRELPFDVQVDTIAQDLRSHFWRPDAQVLAVSFGAYLFLHAQLHLPAYPGRVLLLSPILGEFSDEDSQLGFVPPHARRLAQAAQAGQYPMPRDAQIHVGADDWQSNPQRALTWGHLTGIEVEVVAGRGHDLGRAYVGPLLDRWLDRRLSP